MSLDVYLEVEAPRPDGKDPDRIEVFSYNITHNLGKMAKEAGIYQCLWRPAELRITLAHSLIAPLAEGLELLQSDENRFREFDASNGWGTYPHLVLFVRKYLEACRRWPHARVSASR